MEMLERWESVEKWKWRIWMVVSVGRCLWQYWRYGIVGRGYRLGFVKGWRGVKRVLR